ncbi:MAG: ADP-forming succinate--CoA ligase subunit beta [Chloroflexi bacterium]|nr:ADP-forming succinate--CoA ligase subunit beta [Chloroflexota bacterium]
MKIHEYQAKQILSQAGIRVPKGNVAATAAEAGRIAAELGGRCVIKAQVHAGGRGKAGGIRAATSAADAEGLAARMLGSRLVTAQTSAEGAPVSRVLVEETVEVARELYLGMTVDGSAMAPVMMASTAGGMEIEEVAHTQPEKILKMAINSVSGFQPFHGRQLAFGLGLEPPLMAQATSLMANLYRLFVTQDLSLAEINPLVVTKDGRLLPLDCKLNIDDNALFRRPELAALRDPQQEDALELQALSLGVRNYIKLDGSIGCMVNGAGLAMAVLDQITSAGGRPANFLDIGTANNTERVVNAFKVFKADTRVKAVLVNIFGGMARVDVIAQGIVEAHQQMDITFPIVIRLAGTNVDAGKKILEASGLRFITASDMKDAAEKAVKAAKR